MLHKMIRRLQTRAQQAGIQADAGAQPAQPPIHPSHLGQALAGGIAGVDEHQGTHACAAVAAGQASEAAAGGL